MQAQGLLKTAVSIGQSKEARLARVSFTNACISSSFFTDYIENLLFRCFVNPLPTMARFVPDYHPVFKNTNLRMHS